MPIYEYRCSECGFQDEFLQKLSDPQMTVCPSCGKETLKKLLSAAGFQLKGSGWYATDFKGSGAKPAAKTGGEAKAEGAGSADKPAGESGGDKSGGDKSGGDRSGGDKSGGDRSGGDKSGGDKSGGDKRGGDKRGGDKSGGDKSSDKSADKPATVSKPAPAGTSG